MVPDDCKWIPDPALPSGLRRDKPAVNRGRIKR